MIIPRVQQEETFEGELIIPKVIKVFAADSIGDKATNLFELFIPTVSFVKTDSRSSAHLIFECRFGLSQKDEYYNITACELPIIVNYQDFLGARNAIASIAQLLKKADGDYRFPCCIIEDWPDAKMRSMLIDPARNIIAVPKVKEILVRMAMAKYNYIHLHLSDSQGYVIKSDTLPQLMGPKGKQYSKNQIREIVWYASCLGIECIPEIDFPGHSNQIIKDIPELACVTNTQSEKPSPWVLCVGNEYTYEIMEKLCTELAELFPGKIVHIGGDEIAMYDNTERRTWPTWDCCSRCREMSKHQKIDHNNDTEMFYYWIRRVYNIISKLGKRVMMWNDNIDISISPDLPRDILIHFWRVAGANRGPIEGCSMERFLEEGFEVLNSYYPETYIERDFYKNNDETIRVWSPITEPQHDHKYDLQILGGEPCAWGESNELSHFDWTLPSSIMLFGDRLWNYKPNEYTEKFGIAGTRYQLGIDIPEGFNMFEVFGGFMQPRSVDGTRMWVDKSALDLEKAHEIFSQLENNYLITGKLAGTYRKSIEWLNSSRNKVLK